MKQEEIVILTNAAQTLNIYLPFDMDYEEVPLILIGALVEKYKILNEGFGNALSHLEQRIAALEDKSYTSP